MRPCMMSSDIFPVRTLSNCIHSNMTAYARLRGNACKDGKLGVITARTRIKTDRSWLAMSQSFCGVKGFNKELPGRVLKAFLEGLPSLQYRQNLFCKEQLLRDKCDKIQ
nr:hypothetical protein PsAHV6-024 [Psittacid alphaherpesvirus 6]